MMQTRWRIYTEHCNMHHVKPIIEAYYDDYVFFTGQWTQKGHHERCLVIEIILPVGDGEESIIAICREINVANHKPHCVVTTEMVNVMIVKEKLPIM